MNREAFDSADQAEDYIRALTDRVLPLKFAYVGPAAKTHDKLVRSRQYGLANMEAKLLRSKLPWLSRSLSSNRMLNVVDVGSGNGMKAVLVLRALRSTYRIPAYVALDYSAQLLNIALATVSAALPDQRVIGHSVDFEAQDIQALVQPTRDETGCPSLFLLLGHTLGNPLHRGRALSNIAAGMAPGDHLLVGVELFHPDRVTDVMAHYRNEPFYRAVFNPLSFAGLTRADGILEISFNDTTKDVKVHFRLTKQVSLDLGTPGRLSFAKGERLLIFVSHRFTLSELEDLCSEVGLTAKKWVSGGGETYSLVLVTRAGNADSVPRISVGKRSHE